MSSTIDYPTEITLETLPQLLAAHRARFGGWTMTQDPNPAPAPTPTFTPPEPGAPADPPARPEGVTEDEWKALGDPGQRAIIREREARQAAERSLAAARAKPGPPKKSAEPKPESEPKEPKSDDGAPDIAKIIEQAVAKAVAPFQEKEDQRAVDAAVEKIQTAVLTAAGETFLDPTDALTGIDLTQVTDGNGKADATKIETELEDLLKRKPHLGKTPDGRRYAAPGSPAGAAESTAPLDAKVKETLARMQAAAGIKPAAS